MQVAQKNKGFAGVREPNRSSPDPFSPEAKERRQRLIEAINATHSETAEAADAALSKYLDTLYPKNAVSR